MEFTGQKHFNQKTSVFTLIQLFTQHQQKINLNRSPVIQILLLSVTFSALVVASNFLFALQLSWVEPLLQSVVILHQSFPLLLYYCLSKGKDEPLMHAQGRLVTQLLLWRLLAELHLFTQQETIRAQEGCQQKSMEGRVASAGRGEQDADCPCTPETCRKEGPSSSWPHAMQAAFACCQRGPVRTVTGCVLWTKHCALWP